jgi:hypothetical protein
MRASLKQDARMPMPPTAFLRPTNMSRRKRDMAIAQEVADELLRESMIEAVRLTYCSPFCGRLRALGRHARQRLVGRVLGYIVSKIVRKERQV